MKSIAIVLIWILGNLIFTDADTCTRSAEDCLVMDLLTRYEKYARPIYDPDDSVQVSLIFIPTSLIGIDEKNEQMKIVGTITAEWSDVRLSWNESHYSGADKLNIRADEIWLPDVVLYNSADTLYHKTHREDFFAVVNSEGLVIWNFGGIFATSCSLEITHYPFDSQTCSLELHSWSYPTDMVDLKVDKDVNFEEFSSNSLWDNVSSNVERFETGDTIRHAAIKFSITWERKTMYYYFNIFTPVFFLLAITFGNFWLPPEGGERVTLSITVVLAYSIFLIVIMDNTPINSDSIPVISEFVLAVMILATLSLLESLVIVYLHHKSGRPPKWLRTFTFVYLARFFCSRDEFASIHERENEDTDDSMNKELPDDSGKGAKVERPAGMAHISDMVRQIEKIMEDKKTDKRHADEWVLAAKLLDRLMFCVALLAFAITTIVIFAISA